jgi:RimJ/RimL family protein N-acetyltransferase
VFKIVVQPEGVPAGFVGFWDREWRGETVYEMGWSVLPEHQGRGIASTAAGQAVDLARATSRLSDIHAFPSVDNAPSNGICSKLRFELLGDHEFEYPKGHWIRCNDWRLRL